MKTYVISDVHGLWTRFSDFLDILQEDDSVYVLGDVVDRGPDGIKILRYIMDHPQQFKMLLGNHEHMMLSYLEETKGVDMSKASLWQIKNIRHLYDWWVLRNQGLPTLDAYEGLSSEMQEEVLHFIKSLPVAYPSIKVGDNVFYLVHSMPGSLDKNVVLQTDLTGKKEINRYVWERDDLPTSFYVDDRIVVSGHTMTIFRHGKLEVYISKDEDGNVRYIDIDCGCAMNTSESRLACLCLDDLSIQYF